MDNFDKQCQANTTHGNQELGPVKTVFRDLAAKFDAFLFDCDGVVWQADHQIEGAFDMINWLEAPPQNKKVFFISNNASKTIDEFKERMETMGYKNVKTDQIITGATIMADYL